MKLNHSFSRYLATSFDKQLYLAELVEGLDWHLDLATGILSFGDRYAWRVQLLGTEAEETHTWLWAWANEASNIPPSLLQSASQMKALGEEHHIAEIHDAHVPARRQRRSFPCNDRQERLQCQRLLPLPL